MDLKEHILKRIGEEWKREIERMGFEIIGDIAILETNIDYDVLAHIAEAVKEKHPHVGVVARKVGDVEGLYRVAKHEIIKVYDRSSMLNKLPKRFRNLTPFETVHIEHGCRFLLNINEVYFSSKLGFERKRIADLVKEKEKIAVLFAGVGPFPIVIAKSKNVMIDAVELNEKAVEYFNKNLEINKIQGKVRVHLQDVKEWIKSSDISDYNRILMPAPKDAPTYINEIIIASKKHTLIHYYFFAEKDKIENEIKQLESKGTRVINYRIAGSIGTNKFRVVADLEVI